MKIIVVLLAAVLALSGCATRETYTMQNGLPYSALYVGDKIVQTNYLEDVIDAVDNGAWAVTRTGDDYLLITGADEDYFYTNKGKIWLSDVDFNRYIIF